MSREEVFEKCLKVLRKSKSDNETLAALLMVTKVVQADQTDVSTAVSVFDAVGTKFLRRLLKTGGNSQDNTGDVSFKSVAVSVISCLSSVPGFVEECCTQIFEVLPDLTRVVILNIGSEEQEAHAQLIGDCYDCLSCLIATEQGRQAFILSGAVAIVCEAITGECSGHERGLELLLCLCRVSESEVWDGCEEGLTKLLDHMITSLESDKTDQVFEVCAKCGRLMSSLGQTQVDFLFSTEIPKRLQKIIFHFLQNKLGKDQRNQVLQLCSVAVGLFGVKWLVGDEESGTKFLLLTVHLACIEIRMNLEFEEAEQIAKRGALLGACYSLLELVIEHMTAGPSLQLEDKQVAQLHSGMVGAFNSVTQFLDRMSSTSLTETTRPVVIASIRALGAWIAEETTALRTEVVALLPFLIETSREHFYRCFGATKHEESGESPQDDSSESGLSRPSSDCRVARLHLSREFDDVELFQFLMPGLCHLSAEDTARKVLLTLDLPQVLRDYLVYQTQRLLHSAGKPTGPLQKEPAVAMTTACGVLLNILVLESHVVATENLYREMFNFVSATFQNLQGNDDDDLVTLQYNLMMIGLMVIRHRITDQDMPARSSFITDCIKLLCRVHFTSSGPKHKQVLGCHPQWAEFADLWALSIQVLCECMEHFAWLPKCLLASKWLPRACNMLIDVEASSVPEEVALSYQSLFLSTANHSPAAAHVLKDARAATIAKKYKTTISQSLEAAILEK